MIYILDYEKFNESQMFKAKANVDIDYTVDSDAHFNDRLRRSDNEPDINGSIIINISEVESDIRKAMGDLIVKNLFNNGIYWLDKTNKLNKDILIMNSNTKLNTVIMVNKEKLSYKLTIKTVIRKTGFDQTYSEPTFKIYVV